MRRREFLGAVGSAAVSWPFAVRAQQSDRARRIGILMPFPPANIDVQARVRAFREELRKRGWAAGVNIQFDERWTGDNMDMIRQTAGNLVELKPDAIVAVGGRVIPILIALTHTIPIVVPGGSDPVARGYVETLARPGGNVTGFASMDISVIGKMLQILKEIAPQVARVSMIYNPDNTGATLYAGALQSAATPLRIETSVDHIHGLADIERVIATTAARPDGGLFVAPDLTIETLLEQTVATVARYHLPAVYPQRSFAVGGGLVSYGTDRIDLYRGAASYVDRILRGEKVGDLPYQQPTRYEFVINTTTAKSLGLTVPSNLLFAADETIE